MKEILIVSRNSVEKVIKKTTADSYRYYYISEKYAGYVELKRKLFPKYNICNLSGVFQETYNEVKNEYLALISKLNNQNDSLEWWENHVASKNSKSTQLFLNIVYVFCIKKIVSNSTKSLVFIIDNYVLIPYILKIANEHDFEVADRVGGLLKLLAKYKSSISAFYHITYFLLKMLTSRRTAKKAVEGKSLSGDKDLFLIRSWVTKGNFDEQGGYSDRNFGRLPDWIVGRGYKVLHLPMFFNLSLSTKKTFNLLKTQKNNFIIQESIVTIKDIYKLIRRSLTVTQKKIKNVWIDSFDVGVLINDALRKNGISYSELSLNACYSVIKGLKRKGVEVKNFIYPFENNANEKPFILAVRKFYPNAKLLGFQHSAFFPDNTSFYLGPGEKDFHPLPDKIICSGPIYESLLEQSGFPGELLVNGPNLRFESNIVEKPKTSTSLEEKKSILLPLNLSIDLAAELFDKVQQAVKGNVSYKIYIRTHPLLSKASVFNLIKLTGIDDYVLADDGSIYDWFSKVHVVVTTGASITSVESAVVGVPVIRVVPDNAFHYDALAFPDYPLKAVNTPLEIKEQLEFLENLQGNDSDVFIRTGKVISNAFFSKNDDELLNVFL